MCIFTTSQQRKMAFAWEEHRAGKKNYHDFQLNIPVDSGKEGERNDTTKAKWYERLSSFLYISSRDGKNAILVNAIGVTLCTVSMLSSKWNWILAHIIFLMNLLLLLQQNTLSLSHAREPFSQYTDDFFSWTVVGTLYKLAWGIIFHVSKAECFREF